MFTGIIEATALVISRKESRLTIGRPASFSDVKTGDSIAVSGVCLTVVVFDETSLGFDVIPTTFSKTTLGKHTEGESVNLERAMPANGRFHGHIVQGHCEGVGTVNAVKKEGKDAVFTIDAPQELLKFIVAHGSITIDGVSLTVASVAEKNFTVALIPLTLQETTLGSLEKGDAVNLETDILGRYVLQNPGAVN